MRRLVILGVLVTFCAVILAPTLRAYIHQRGQISSLHDQIAQQRQSVSSLRAEKDRWKDPRYVEQQARERLKFVKPGEKQYTTIDGDGSTGEAAPKSGIARVSDEDRSTRPWYGEVWESLVIADSGATKPSSAPADSSGPPPVRDPSGK